MNRTGEPVKIVEILALPSQGLSIGEICRTHNISPATFYNWCNKLGPTARQTVGQVKSPINSKPRFGECAG
ncbi:transposase [Larkinella bovis]|uniref:Transposase n=1 Tax=Larkinella bovis TaxID=683041 RepID=A0ABW0II95_9BACT